MIRDSLWGALLCFDGRSAGEKRDPGLFYPFCAPVVDPELEGVEEVAATEELGLALYIILLTSNE